MQYNLPEVNIYLSQFRKAYTKLEDGNLSPTQYVLLTYAYDLMKLSWRNKDYYDKKHNDYYCICTQENIRKRWNIGRSTITRTFQSLEKMGYIIRRKSKRGTTKIFCPHISFVNKSPKPNLSFGQLSKWADTQSYVIKSDVNYTSDTSSVSSSKNSNNIILKFNGNASNQQKHSEEKHDEEFERQTQLNTLKRGLLNSHVPAQAINYAFKLYSSYEILHNKIFNTLFKAKKRAKKDAKENINETYHDIKYGGFVGEKEAVDTSFNFETNKILTDKLPEKLRNVLYKAEHNSNNFCKYLYVSLHDFFTKVSQEHVHESAKDVQPEIPIFKIK